MNDTATMTAEAPAWAKGFPVDFLKEVAKIFREEFKPHTYGAFGIPKERDVADARADNCLIWTFLGGERIAGAAIFKILTRGSVHHDFTGAALEVPAGTCLVRSIAGSVEAKAKILDHLSAKAPVWVEVHAENEDAVRLLASKKKVALTKIAASSDIRLLMAPLDAPSIKVSPADEIGIKVVDPAFVSADEMAAVLAELDAVGREAFAQHYSGYNKRSSWTSFALQGFDPADPGFIIKPAEMSKAWKDENPARLGTAVGRTAIADQFPVAEAIVKRIPGDKERVRFMRLAGGGGELSRHADITDPDAGTADGKLCRIHIPIVTHERVRFKSWQLDGSMKEMHMPPRSLCYLDTRKPHAAVNPGEIERIHLVVDAVSSPALRAMLTGA